MIGYWLVGRKLEAQEMNIGFGAINNEPWILETVFLLIAWFAVFVLVGLDSRKKK